MAMKKMYFFGIAVLALTGLCSCENQVAHEGGVNCDNEVKEGRIWTQTRRSHTVHQNLTPEERELAKDHIKDSTTFGASFGYIDSEGAKVVNESRNK